MSSINGRDIVVCLDGTWDNPQGYVSRRRPHPLYTNVYKIFFVLRGATQVKAYWAGVGAYSKFDRLLMGATGNGGWSHLLLSYQYVLANYEPGDRIFIFGFSRGAYIARHLAGLITRAGLDRRYLVRTHKVVLDYVRKFSYDGPAAGVKAPIQFLGLWDTVTGGSWGGLTVWPRKEHHNGPLEDGIQCAAHAISVDERRIAFRPEIYEGLGGKPRLVQRLFRGAHADIGGGNRDSRLSDTTLTWMAERARSAGLEVPDLAVALPGLGIPFSPGTASPSYALWGFGLSCGRMSWLKRQRGFQTIEPVS